MAGCVLRVDGIKDFPSSWADHDDGSNEVVLTVSEADENFQQQISEAIDFLLEDKCNLNELFPTNSELEMSLDFGVWLNISPAQAYSFPSKLVSLAAKFGISLEVTIYAS